MRNLAHGILSALLLYPACSREDDGDRSLASRDAEESVDEARSDSSEPVEEWRRWRNTETANERKSIPGRWQRLQDRPARNTVLSPEDLAALEALGYAAGSEPARRLSGVVVHDRGAAAAGLNLYVSGHGPEATLIDMDGRVVHKWGFDFFDGFPDHFVPRDVEFPNRFRRVHLFDNGDLLAIYEGNGLVKLDRHSQLIWGLDEHHIHHDLHVLEDGTIWTLGRQAEDAPEISTDNESVINYALELAPDGTLRRKLSVLDCLRGSSWEGLIEAMGGGGDVMHCNTIQVLDGMHVERSAAFAAGNLLVAIRNVDAIVIIDPRAERVVWA